MKIKEILKNKWGWAGAVISSLIFFSFRMEINGEIGGGFKFEPSKLIDTFNQYITATYYPISPIIVTLIVFIVGFILGLILQKIYRRIK